MPYQELKMYQAGTYVVGNRLLDPEERSVQANARPLQRAHLRATAPARAAARRWARATCSTPRCGRPATS